MAVGFVVRRDATVSERVTFEKRIDGIMSPIKKIDGNEGDFSQDK